MKMDQAYHEVDGLVIKSEDEINTEVVQPSDANGVHCKSKTEFHPIEEILINQECVVDEKENVEQKACQSIDTNNRYKCNLCGKCFAVKRYLHRHVQTHTKIKLYECKQCGKCFAEKSNLSGHVSIHGGIKPHKCRMCEKSFTRRQVAQVRTRLLCNQSNVT